jgi:hypothetical protein
MIRERVIAAGMALLALGALPAFAQSSQGGYSDVPDRYRIDVGGFRLGSSTNLRRNDGSGGGSDVAFENDLLLPDTSTRAYLEGSWRISRRHQLSLGWFRNKQAGPAKTLSRDIDWGEHVFTANTQVKAEAGATYISGVYRFAAYRNDRFEIGPALGLGHLSPEATISTVVSVGGASGSASRGFAASGSLGQVTGDLGGYINWWPAKRLLMRGDARYILIKPENSEASVTDARASAVYHPLQKLGVGLQYTYSKFRYTRGILDRALGGQLRYSGLQLLATAAF